MSENKGDSSERDLAEENGISDPFLEEQIGSFGERLEQLIERKKVSRRTLASMSGTTEASIRNYIKGRMPQIDVAYRMAKFLGVSLDELISGTSTKSSMPGEYAFIPMYSVKVSAGHGFANNNEEDIVRRLAFRKNWLNFRGLRDSNLAMVMTQGDSMEPTLHSGNSLLIDTSNKNLTDGCIYVIRVGNELYAKRLQKQFNGDVRLISDNKEYDDQLVQIDEIDQLQIVGKVVWVGKDLY
jgi:transcriptional regulator with XRE-family HTH domain